MASYSVYFAWGLSKSSRTIRRARQLVDDAFFDFSYLTPDRPETDCGDLTCPVNLMAHLRAEKVEQQGRRVEYKPRAKSCGSHSRPPFRRTQSSVERSRDC